MLVKVTSTGMSCSFLFQAGKILNPAVSVVPGDCGAGYTVSNISPCKYNGVSIVNPTAVPKSFMIKGFKIFLYLPCHVFQTERWLYCCILFLNNLSIVTKLKIRTKSSDEKNIFFHLPACMVSSWLFQSVSCYPRSISKRNAGIMIFNLFACISPTYEQTILWMSHSCRIW